MMTSITPSDITVYACPVCQQTLSEQDKTLRCSSNHSFDRHKKGYVNLLLSQHKSSKEPGDNADMVKGRREFLRAGHYQMFADAITNLATVVQQNISESMVILDAGCGEGFYTEQLQETLSTRKVFGLDISKPAITAAANNKNIDWCVASSNRLPFIDDSIDLIVSIFSRIEKDAFMKVLKPGGYVLYAGPGDNHLHALRSIIYDQVNDYSTDKHHDYFGEDFLLVEERSLQIPILLNSQKDIKQLISMTPHAHRIPKSGYERLQNTQKLQDIGDFKLYLYQKK